MCLMVGTELVGQRTSSSEFLHLRTALTLSIFRICRRTMASPGRSDTFALTEVIPKHVCILIERLTDISERQDTIHRYLHPLLHDGKHPNLYVLAETKVERVLFDDHKRAVGLVVLPNTDHRLL